MSEKKKSARSTRARVSNLLSDEERAAMKETLKERRRALSGEADGESDALAKIAEMAEPDRGRVADHFSATSQAGGQADQSHEVRHAAGRRHRLQMQRLKSRSSYSLYADL